MYFSSAISGKNIFYLSDWRFNEFPNASAHALYVTCVELLSLPVVPAVVANNVIDVIVKGYPVIPSSELHGWINVLGLLMTALPEAYWSVIYDRLQDTIKANKMTSWTYRCSPFDMFNFKTVKEAMLEKSYVLLLAIAQSILHHSSIGQIATLSTWVIDCSIVSNYIQIQMNHFLQLYNGETEAARAGRTTADLRVPFVWSVYAATGSRATTRWVRYHDNIVRNVGASW